MQLSRGLRYKKFPMLLTNAWGKKYIYMYIYPFVSGIGNDLYFSLWIWEFTEIENVSWIECNLKINVPFPPEWRKISSILLSLPEPPSAECGANHRIKKYPIVPLFYCLLWLRVVNPGTREMEKVFPSKQSKTRREMSWKFLLHSVNIERRETHTKSL